VCGRDPLIDSSSLNIVFSTQYSTIDGLDGWTIVLVVQ